MNSARLSKEILKLRLGGHRAGWDLGCGNEYREQPCVIQTKTGTTPLSIALLVAGLRAGRSRIEPDGRIAAPARAMPIATGHQHDFTALGVGVVTPF